MLSNTCADFFKEWFIVIKIALILMKMALLMCLKWVLNMGKSSKLQIIFGGQIKM